MAEPKVGIEDEPDALAIMDARSPKPSQSERFATLAEGIRATESFLAGDERRVDDRLTDEALRTVYERRLSLSLPPLPFRAATIETLLERAQEMLVPRRLIVPAQGEVTERRQGEDLRATLRISTGEGEALLSWSVPRIFDARFWGIEIRPEDEDARSLLEERIWELLLSKLVSDISAVTRIEERFADRPASDVVLLPDREGEAFERLCVEILNEGPLRARLAVLFEDFMEKTDLRVMIPGLDRKRGARVQVSITQSGERVLSKRNAIRAAPEFVLLSPWTLAEALAAAPGSGLLSPEEAHAVYHAIGKTGGTPETVARALRSVFLYAIRNPGRDPRGPLSRVPPPVRRLLQAFVEHEGKSATDVLRARESRARDQQGGS